MSDLVSSIEGFQKVDETLRELGLDMADGIADPKVTKFIGILFEAELEGDK
jgi:hypothetical protein